MVEESFRTIATCVEVGDMIDMPGGWHEVVDVRRFVNTVGVECVVIAFAEMATNEVGIKAYAFSWHVNDPVYVMRRRDAVTALVAGERLGR